MASAASFLTRSACEATCTTLALWWSSFCTLGCGSIATTLLFCFPADWSRASTREDADVSFSPQKRLHSINLLREKIQCTALKMKRSPRINFAPPSSKLQRKRRRGQCGKFLKTRMSKRSESDECEPPGPNSPAAMAGGKTERTPHGDNTPVILW